MHAENEKLILHARTRKGTAVLRPYRSNRRKRRTPSVQGPARFTLRLWRTDLPPEKQAVAAAKSSVVAVGVAEVEEVKEIA